jgi:DNA polymerase-3 subunit epsilon
VDRALVYLAGGPADSLALARDVLGLPAAPPVIAERLAMALLGADPRITRLDDGRWVGVPAGVTSPRLRSCTFAVVDLETTGGRPARGDRIVEVAVVLVRGEAIELAYQSLVNPGTPLPRYVASLTGISDVMLADRPRFGEVAADVLCALGGRVFVAHNARFDWALLSAELKRTCDRVLFGPRVCTLRLARWLIPALRSRGLDQVTRFFGIPVANRHRAAGDALATASVLLRLLDLAEAAGAQTLDDLIRTSTDERRRAQTSARPPRRSSALAPARPRSPPADDTWPW